MQPHTYQWFMALLRLGKAMCHATESWVNAERQITRQQEQPEHQPEPPEEK